MGGLQEKRPTRNHCRDSGSCFQDLADEAFADLLKKRKQPVGLKASL